MARTAVDGGVWLTLANDEPCGRLEFGKQAWATKQNAGHARRNFWETLPLKAQSLQSTTTSLYLRFQSGNRAAGEMMQVSMEVGAYLAGWVSTSSCLNPKPPK